MEKIDPKTKLKAIMAGLFQLSMVAGVALVAFADDLGRLKYNPTIDKMLIASVIVWIIFLISIRQPKS